MSGTSMDGIDAALLRTDGKINIQEVGFAALKYDPQFQILMKAAEYSVRKYQGDVTQAKKDYQNALYEYLENELNIAPTAIAQKISELNNYLHHNKTTEITFDDVEIFSTKLHAEIIKSLLQQTNYRSEQIDIIGYHGQTLFHRPAHRITIQMGDGKLLAELTGIAVINNFRQRDIAAGGQGAPFAPLYHQALAIRDNKLPMAVVNCGGISNITIITGKAHDQVIGFDTGAGNGLIDRLIKQRTHSHEMMDFDGKYGLGGKVHNDILQKLYQNAVIVEGGDFFEIKPPKALDIGDLNLIPELETLSLEDACATLEAFTADNIVRALDYIDAKQFPTYWVLAGGGWHNPVILRELKQRIEKKIGSQVEVNTADNIGWNSQALEAQIFAYFAVRSLQGLAISVPGTTRVPYPLTGGCAYVPEKGATSAVNEMLRENSLLS